MESNRHGQRLIKSLQSKSTETIAFIESLRTKLDQINEQKRAAEAEAKEAKRLAEGARASEKEAQQRLNQLLSLKEFHFDDLIREIFEQPKKQLESSIARNARRTSRLTLIATLASIAVSFATSFSISYFSNSDLTMATRARFWQLEKRVLAEIRERNTSVEGKLDQITRTNDSVKDLQVSHHQSVSKDLRFIGDNARGARRKILEGFASVQRTVAETLPGINDRSRTTHFNVSNPEGVLLASFERHDAILGTLGAQLERGLDVQKSQELTLESMAAAIADDRVSRQGISRKLDAVEQSVSGINQLFERLGNRFPPPGRTDQIETIP